MRTTFRPIQLVDVELADPPVAIEAGVAPTGERYDRVRLLVRSQGVPLGVVERDLPAGGVDGETVRHWVSAQATVGTTEAPERPPEPHGPSPVSVVIATRDRPRELRRVLLSLRASTRPPREVVVVENAPRPTGAEEVVRSLSAAGSPLRYVWEHRPGLARAHNTGIVHTTAPLVAFTDDDVEVDPRWLAAIIEAFADHPDAGCVTGLIYPRRLDAPAQEKMEEIGFGKGLTRRVFSLEDQGDPLWPFTVGGCGSGANMAFRREALAGVGGFDDRLGAGTRCRGGDDLAAFFDLITAGWSVVYRPDALVRHDHDPDPQGLSTRAFGYGMGLGAHLTRAVLRDPRRFLQAMRRLLSRPWTGTAARSPGLASGRWLAGLTWGPVALGAATLGEARTPRPRPSAHDRSPAWR